MRFPLPRVGFLLLVACLASTVRAEVAKSRYADLTTAVNKTALKPGQEVVIAVQLDVKPHYHAQSHTPSDPNYIAYKVTIDENPAFTVGTPTYPEGEDRDFGVLGRLNVYVGKSVTYVPITVKADAKPGDLKISGSAKYQACDDTVCYAPQTVKFEIATKVVGASDPIEANEAELFKGYQAGRTATTQATTAPAAKPAGSPPAAAKGDTGWGAWFSKPWFVWPVTAILVVMALGMFGLFTFRLPLGVYTIEPRHDTYIGNFLFGILTAVLSTPCTAPLFPGLLAWAVLQAKTGGRFVGVGVITMVGVGMAIPYLLLSAFPELARRVPRTGAWSELIKQLMGFLVLGVAGYFAGQQLLAGNHFMWVVFAIAVAAGIFLIARTAKLMPRPRPVIIAAILAICIGSGTFALAHTLNKPSVVTWQPYSADAVEKANQAGKLALVDLTAKWCANCQWIEATTYADPAAVRALSSKDVAMFKADLTNEGAPGWAIVNELNPGGGIPLTAIYSPKRAGQPYVLKSIYRTPTLLGALDAAKKGSTFSEESGKDMSALFAFSIALLVGIIFNVMPCVLPVLPLKAIGFYEVSQHNRAKSISYGLVFSLGIIATFAALALLVLPVAGPAGAAVAVR